MRAPHEMSDTERRDTVLQSLDNAKYLWAMHSKSAEFYFKRDPVKAKEFQELADGWEREYRRLKAICNRWGW